MRVLEVNDAALVLSDGERLLQASPGFALADGRRLVIGEAARQQFRVHPRRVLSRYWYQLDQTPLATAFGEARSHADLAWAQLAALREQGAEGPLLLAVPGSFDSTQLGLLLALARAAKLDAVGLVDSAVAAASTVDAARQVLHVDVQLHRWWLTRLSGSDAGDLARSGGEDLAKPGWLAVWDACAGVIAAAFVQQTRYDPLHSAATEQALYDRLPGWLAQFGRGAAVTLELPAGLRSHRASLPADALDAALAPIVSRIAAGVAAAAVGTAADTAILLSAAAAGVPGLAGAIVAATGIRPQALAPLAVAHGALAHAGRIRHDGEALPFVTRLPARAAAASAVPVTPLPRPTHVLVGDVALPLSPAEAAAYVLGAVIDTPQGRGRAIQVRERPA